MHCRNPKRDRGNIVPVGRGQMNARGVLCALWLCGLISVSARADGAELWDEWRAEDANPWIWPSRHGAAPAGHGWGGVALVSSPWEVNGSPVLAVRPEYPQRLGFYTFRLGESLAQP